MKLGFFAFYLKFSECRTFLQNQMLLIIQLTWDKINFLIFVAIFRWEKHLETLFPFSGMPAICLVLFYTLVLGFHKAVMSIKHLTIIELYYYGQII